MSKWRVEWTESISFMAAAEEDAVNIVASLVDKLSPTTKTEILLNLKENVEDLDVSTTPFLFVRGYSLIRSLFSNFFFPSNMTRKSFLTMTESFAL